MAKSGTDTNASTSEISNVVAMGHSSLRCSTAARKSPRKNCNSYWAISLQLSRAWASSPANREFSLHWATYKNQWLSSVGLTWPLVSW